MDADYRSGPSGVESERGQSASSYAIVTKSAGWCRALGLKGALSQSGRCTAIANLAGRIFDVGGSLRDV